MGGYLSLGKKEMVMVVGNVNDFFLNHIKFSWLKGYWKHVDWKIDELI